MTSLMKIEVANEAYTDLHAVLTCDKNGVHEGFDNFCELNLLHLPENVKNEETLTFIKNFGDRVVRLEVQKPTGSIYGSGVVFRAAPFHFIMTNDHVVGSDEDVKNCSIDFFYNTEDRTGVETSRGIFRLGNSAFQDRCLFVCHPVPRAIENMDLFDHSQRIANVTYMQNDDCKSVQGYLMEDENKWFVWISRENIDTSNITSWEIAFQEHKAKFVDINFEDEKSIQIEISHVPDYLKKTFTRGPCPWPSNKEFTPFIISHPHGGPKKLTRGKHLAAEVDGLYGKLYHTAKTCPGSSGGLFITVGGDATHTCIGHPAYHGIHCEGRRADEFRGVPIETGNLNMSLFNT